MYGTAGGGGGYRDDAYASSQAEPLTGGGARRRQVRAVFWFSFRMRCAPRWRIGCQFPSVVSPRAFALFITRALFLQHWLT